MKITTQLIDLGEYNYKRYFGSDLLDNTNIVLLLTILLHKNGKISREKMMGMLRSIREGKYVRALNTHHCTINNKWYNTESSVDVLKYAFNDSNCSIKEIDLEELLTYLNLYLNKPRNYCIDFVLTEFVRPCIDKYVNYPDEHKYLESFNINLNGVNTTSYHNLYISDFDYCCEDCSGDYEDFRRNKYQNQIVEENIKNYKKIFSDYLHAKKKHPKGFEIPKKELY